MKNTTEEGAAPLEEANKKGGVKEPPVPKKREQKAAEKPKAT